jgi:hypothetical protein
LYRPLAFAASERHGAARQRPPGDGETAFPAIRVARVAATDQYSPAQRGVFLGAGAVVRSGRVRGVGSFLARALPLLWLLAIAVGAASAEEPAARSTIVVFGDSQAQGLSIALQRVVVEDPRYRILNRTHPGAALVHGENEWLGPIEKFAARETADIAVVMFGANDRLDMRGERGGPYLHFRTDEWRAAYAARIDRILAALGKAGLRVLWCGNPIARSPAYSADMGYINEIYAEEMVRFGAQFLPLWDIVADEQGRYVAYAKDRDGVTQRMRTDDGIHFTAAGYELIAERIIELLSTAAANAR